MDMNKIEQAIAAVNACCGHCGTCSPTCPIAIARRALSGLRDDLLDARNMSS